MANIGKLELQYNRSEETPRCAMMEWNISAGFLTHFLMLFFGLIQHQLMHVLALGLEKYHYATPCPCEKFCSDEKLPVR